MIFSGYNQRAVFAFLRYISHSYSEYVIVAKAGDDDILRSSYAEKVIYVRKKRELDMEEILEVIDSLSYGKIVIMPTTEALNRFLLDNREVLLSHRCFVPLVDFEMYQQISDKSSFYHLCKGAGISVPKIIDITSNFRCSYVAKPKRYYNERGETISPIIVNDKDGHDRFWARDDICDFDIQEYVEGESYYLLYYFDKKGRVVKYSQRNLLQQPGGKSIIAAVSSTIHEESISQQYEKLFLELGYYGLVMVEVRKRDGIFYMIEANPRFWGPSQLFVDAGVGLFGHFLKDCGIVLDFNEEIKGAFYYWGGGRSSTEVWLCGGKELFTKNMLLFVNADVYNREDSIEIYKRENGYGQE